MNAARGVAMVARCAGARGGVRQMQQASVVRRAAVAVARTTARDASDAGCGFAARGLIGARASHSVAAPSCALVSNAAPAGVSGSRQLSTRKKKPTKPDDHPYVNKNARYLPGFSFPAPRKLKDIVKMQLLERESTHHIRDIWLDHHADRGDCIAGTLTVMEGRELEERGRKWCVPAAAGVLAAWACC